MTDQAVRPRLTRRALVELLDELLDDGTKVIVLAIVANERIHESSPRSRGSRALPRPMALPTPSSPRPPGSGWASLTDRERMVALLAGHALTNQQIASRLQISPHTVNYHLRQVFKKLAIDSRVSLARIVQAHPPVTDMSGLQR
jgi:DNA-binding CsgD family transcriptional regulator